MILMSELRGNRLVSRGNENIRILGNVWVPQIADPLGFGADKS